MIYIISTEIRGFNYFVKVKGAVTRNTTDFRFEGLKNNATEFYSYQDAADVLKHIRSKNNLNIIPKTDPCRIIQK
jgi:hypothetical protein